MAERTGECRICGVVVIKPGKRGFVPWYCPPCKRKINSDKANARNKANPARHRALQQAYRLRNDAVIRERRKQQFDSTSSRIKKLRLEYNMTVEQYRELLADQGGGCALCGSADAGSRAKTEFAFVVDHDHACCPTKARSCGRCIRGLLCHRCNRGIGLFGDDTALMRAAIQYLERTR